MHVVCSSGAGVWQMKTYTFTVTAEFEIHGTVKAEDKADAESKLNDMELAVFESHSREIVTESRAGGAGCSRLRIERRLVHYPPTVGVYREENHSFRVGEIQDPHVTDLSVEEGN